MLARCEHDLPDCDHALFANGFPDHRKRLLTNLAVRGYVIGTIQVQFVDLFLRHELVDVNRSPALDRDGFQLLGIEFDVIARSRVFPAGRWS